MSDMEYLKMLEVPVNSCDVYIKPSKKKKKNVVEEIIDKVNSGEETQKTKKQTPKLYRNNIKKKKKPSPILSNESETVSVKSSKFDIISVQVVAVFTLIVGIILTNIFWENSGMNNLMRQVFGSSTEKNTATYSSFSTLSPSKLKR